VALSRSLRVALVVGIASLAAAPAAQSAITLAAPANTSVGGPPSRVVSADFDGDGDRDVAVTRPGANAVAILLNSGAGTFAAFRTYAVGAQAAGIAVGDLDADGAPDLVVANGFGDTVSILKGTGTGTFLTAITRTVGNEPREVAIGDLDNDGRPDIVTADNGTFTFDGMGGSSGASNLTVLLQAADGSFPNAGTVVSAGVPGDPAALVIGDVNADGDRDLLVLSGQLATMKALLGDGSGATFPASANTNGGSSTGTSGLVVRDINADGRLDALVSDRGAAFVRVNLGDGAGIFGSGGTANFLIDQGLPADLRLGDMDGDGLDDLITVSPFPGSIEVGAGAGTGAFGAPVAFSVAGDPARLAVADFTGDGVLDVMTANQGATNVSLLRSAGTASLGSALTFTSQPQTTVSTPQAISITNNGSAPLVISALGFTGTNPGDFLIGADSCHAPVAPGGSCTASVRFAPQAANARSASFTVTSNGATSSASVTVSGTGGSLPMGPEGPAGDDGAPGAPGTAGTAGAAGAMGAAGTAGATGAKGDKGDKGDTGSAGATGAAGRDARVTCSPKGTKKVKVTCRVVLAASRAARARWRLAQGEHVVARGVAMLRHGEAGLDLRGVRPGRYVLSVRYRKSGRAVTVRRTIRIG
jgi:hypothetical protein